jgi:hypothetical protein
MGPYVSTRMSSTNSYYNSLLRVSLFPTGGVIISLLAYMSLTLIGTAVLALPPPVFLQLKKPGWKIDTPLTKESLVAPIKQLLVS